MELGKGNYKFIRKRNSPLGHILVTSMMPTKSHPPLQHNVIDFASDQYQGMRDYNEDRIVANKAFAVNGKTYSFFGVFDGHGGTGVADYLKTNIEKHF